MLHIVLLAAQVLMGLPILYLCLVSVAAAVASRHAGGTHDLGEAVELPTFAMVIPAHNEERDLPQLLASVDRLRYPRQNVDVYVVADNCTDATAALARDYARDNGGGCAVRVFERTDSARRGKGYALAWMFEYLKGAEIPYDAYVIVDADSLLDPEFLEAMAEALEGGAQVCQGHYAVVNATDSASAALRWLALSLMNYIRPLGRTVLGGSSTLTGNGMCLRATFLHEHPWQSFSTTEDYQYYLKLVLAGIRVQFVPRARVLSAMPGSFAQMYTQDVRWESDGNSETRRVLWCLLRDGVRVHDWLHVDAMLELAVPPLSVLMGWVLAVGAASLVLHESLIGPLVLVGGLGIYVGSAFLILRPPLSVYRGVSLVPLFVARKLWILTFVRYSRRGAQEWVRTDRAA